MFMLWQRVFAAKDADEGNRGLILGSAIAALVYVLVDALMARAAFLAVTLACLPACCICLLVECRRLNGAQPMFEDAPREHRVTYRKAVRDAVRGACAVGAIGFCSGSIRTLANGSPDLVAIENLASMGCLFVLSIALLVYWQFKSVRFSTSTAYRLFFPFLITGLLLVPFLGRGYLWTISGGIQAVFSCAAAILAITSARVSRDQGVRPVFIYGFCCGVAYLMRNLGAVAGLASVQFQGFGIGAEAFVVVLDFYLLGVMFFVGRGGFSLRARPVREAVDVELVSSTPMAQGTAKASAMGKGSMAGKPPASGRASVARTPAAAKDHATTEVFAAEGRSSTLSASLSEASRAQAIDLLDDQCEQVRDCFRLSLRETEVLGLVVRGYSVPAMAERLFISENTVQTHMKHIYSKLAVHKKQELLDIVEGFAG